jgi:hypothetical protein
VESVDSIPGFDQMADLRISDFSQELALAVACMRHPFDEAAQEEIRRRAAAKLDWNQFLAWVKRHRIGPLVHYRFGQVVCSTIPEPVLEQLQEDVKRNRRQVLTQVSEAARIKRSLDATGIRSMMIKGPVLSLLAFGDPTLRVSRDVDLYVDRNRVSEANRLIIEAGYRRFAPDLELTPRQQDAFLRMRCQFAYFSAQTGVVQELHWRLTSNAALMPIDEATLWSRPEPVRLNGVDFHTLPDEEMFLYLCVHGSGHVWFRLKWLADVAALLSRMSSSSLERIARRARALGIERPLNQTLLLAHTLLAAPIPADILSRARQSGAARRLVITACRALNWAGTPSEPAETRWFNTWVAMQAYRLKPTLGYRWAEFQDQMCSPEDWARLPLPERLYFLYLPLRPVSWALRKAIGALTR